MFCNDLTTLCSDRTRGLNHLSIMNSKRFLCDPFIFTLTKKLYPYAIDDRDYIYVARVLRDFKNVTVELLDMLHDMLFVKNVYLLDYCDFLQDALVEHEKHFGCVKPEILHIVDSYCNSLYAIAKGTRYLH